MASPNPLQRIGGGFAYSPTKSPDDRLARLERDVLALRQQNEDLRSELSRKVAQLEAHTQARAALQAEVSDARQFGSRFADELERIKTKYSSVETIHASEINGLRAALEATGTLCEQQRRSAESAAAEYEARERDYAQRWDEERAALVRAQEVECNALRAGWAEQSAKLVRQATAEKARADALASGEEAARRHASAELQRLEKAWAEERATLQRSLEEAKAEATGAIRAAEAAKAAHDEARQRLSEGERRRKEEAEAHSAAAAQQKHELDAAGQALDGERSARGKLEGWAKAAQEKLEWLEEALAAALEREAEAAATAHQASDELRARGAESLAASAARDAEHSYAQSELAALQSRCAAAEQRYVEAERLLAEERASHAEARSRLAAKADALNARLAGLTAERETLVRDLSRATAAERDAARLSRATAESAAEALQAEALKACEARTALAEAHGRAQTASRRCELALHHSPASGPPRSHTLGVAASPTLPRPATLNVPASPPLASTPDAILALRHRVAACCAHAAQAYGASAPSAAAGVGGLHWGDLDGGSPDAVPARSTYSEAFAAGLRLAAEAAQAAQATAATAHRHSPPPSSLVGRKAMAPTPDARGRGVPGESPFLASPAVW